jgi:hypothetical protein
VEVGEHQLVIESSELRVERINSMFMRSWTIDDAGQADILWLKGIIVLLKRYIDDGPIIGQPGIAWE